LEELISVIIPVYNVNKYLNKCIGSIVNQTYKNLEIILVDDGSTDNSGEICDEWKQKDSRIKVIHKENGGPSNARNFGIEIAIGKYLFFIDADDYLNSDNIETLYKNLIENDSDISASGHIYETYIVQENKCAKESYVADSEEALKRLFTGNNLFVVIWGKLFKKELFEEIRFPVGKINEDVATLYKLIHKANKISNINKPGYHYVQRQNSLIHQKYGEERITVVEILEECVEFIRKNYPNLVEYAERYLILALNDCAILTSKNKMKKEYRNLRKKLKQYLPMILKNSKMEHYTRKRSILIVLGFARFLIAANC